MRTRGAGSGRAWPSATEYTSTSTDISTRQVTLYSPPRSGQVFVQGTSKGVSMTRKFRWPVPFLALAATMVAGTASAAAAPTVQLDGVRTTLWTDPATTKVLLANRSCRFHLRHPRRREVDAAGPVRGLRLPDPQRPGRRDHAGRLHQQHGRPKFVNLANGKHLSLTAFRIVIDAHPRLTAIVNGVPNVRVTILRLDLSRQRSPSRCRTSGSATSARTSTRPRRAP